MLVASSGIENHPSTVSLGDSYMYFGRHSHPSLFTTQRFTAVQTLMWHHARGSRAVCDLKLWETATAPISRPSMDEMDGPASSGRSWILVVEGLDSKQIGGNRTASRRPIYQKRADRPRPAPPTMTEPIGAHGATPTPPPALAGTAAPPMTRPLGFPRGPATTKGDRFALEDF